VIIEETTNTNVIVYGWTQPGVQPTIYRTHGEHASQYTTDVSANQVLINYLECFINRIIFNSLDS